MQNSGPVALVEGMQMANWRVETPSIQTRKMATE